MKGTESKSYEQQLSWEYFSLEKKILRTDLSTLHNYLKGDGIRVGVGLFSQANSDRMRGHSLKLLGEIHVGHQEEFVHRKCC